MREEEIDIMELIIDKMPEKQKSKQELSFIWKVTKVIVIIFYTKNIKRNDIFKHNSKITYARFRKRDN